MLFVKKPSSIVTIHTHVHDLITNVMDARKTMCFAQMDVVLVLYIIGFISVIGAHGLNLNVQINYATIRGLQSALSVPIDRTHVQMECVLKKEKIAHHAQIGRNIVQMAAAYQ